MPLVLELLESAYYLIKNVRRVFLCNSDMTVLFQIKVASFTRSFNILTAYNLLFFSIGIVGIPHIRSGP